MLAPIQFHDQFRGRAKEIGIVRPDRLLTPKSRAGKTLIPDQIPQPALGLGLICAKMFGCEVGHRESLSR
jgi:hypothetical protein